MPGKMRPNLVKFKIQRAFDHIILNKQVHSPDAWSQGNSITAKVAVQNTHVLNTVNCYGSGGFLPHTTSHVNIIVNILAVALLASHKHKSHALLTTIDQIPVETSFKSSEYEKPYS